MRFAGTRCNERSCDTLVSVGEQSFKRIGIVSPQWGIARWIAPFIPFGATRR